MHAVTKRQVRARGLGVRLALIISIIGSLITVVDTAPVAATCTCKGHDDATSPAALAPAGAVATVIGKAEGGQASRVENADVWVIEILQDLMGNLPEQVAVVAESLEETDCGVNWIAGRDVTVLLFEDPETGWLRVLRCQTISREAFDAWQPFTGTPGEASKLTFFEGARAYRVIAFDDNDQPRAFGFEPGTVVAHSLCPDETAMMELVREDDTWRVDVRQLETFEATTLASDLAEADRVSCIDDATALVGDQESAAQVDASGVARSAEKIPQQPPANNEATPVRYKTLATSTVVLATPAMVSQTASAPAAKLDLAPIPATGGWSPWLLVLGLAAVGAYLLHKMRDPAWRQSWNKPNNARNAGSARRREDPTGGQHFGH